ncbi:hypothetical protein [uncultured Hymenobacter sp.]|uniref:hypothetical protein n=1 Tax=uncultured Hymenobacter sp. TaxID=170016 RepID=UPI0035CA5C3D
MFERIERGDFRVYVSDVTRRELAPAPPRVRELLTEIPTAFLINLALTPEAEALATAYIAGNALGKGSLADAQHIALASVNRLDVLVSWNFKHIVNLDRIRFFQAINLQNGYPAVDIRSPLEFLEL